MDVWTVSGGCLDGIWKVSGRFWKLSGRCLHVVKEDCGEYKESLLKVRSSQDRCCHDKSSQNRSSHERSSPDRSSKDMSCHDI